MQVIGALDALSNSISTFLKNGKSIGFVPTMGALHAGHMALVEKSVEQNEVTIVSIFVNPLQFNNEKDLKKYPRVVEDDTELLKMYDVDIVFVPKESDLYPVKPVVSINFGSLSEQLEGEFRAGHFEGVGVIVSKLLHLTNPTRAYFGLKDLQQFVLVRQMCADLGFPTEIIGVETVREPSGLAMSSRNRLLSKSGREDASIISEGLNRFRDGITSGQSIKFLTEQVQRLYAENERFELEYLEVIDLRTFSKVENYDHLDELAVCVAGYVEGVRLIDNLYLRLK